MNIKRAKPSVEADMRDHITPYLSAMIDAIAANVAILDEHGVIVQVNQLWKQFSAQNNTSDSLNGVGSNYLAVCDAAAAHQSRDGAAVASGIRAVLRDHTQLFRHEYPCFTRTEKLWFEAQVGSFDLSDRRYVLVAHHDISRLQSARYEIEAQHRETRAILDSMHEAVLTVDYGRFCSCVQYCCQPHFWLRCRCAGWFSSVTAYCRIWCG